MIFKKLNSGIEMQDEEFDTIYPKRLKKISEIHFTPVKVAQVAAQFLAEKPGASVLDIGSGAGKFCMVAEASTKGYFVGVEQRKDLHKLAEKLSKRYGLTNVQFLLSNIMEVDFEAYDSIYFYNAFYENIFHNGAIDQSLTLDKSLYVLYTKYIYKQLDKMPIGTRLATYFSAGDEIPEAYKIKATDFDLKLKLWEKMD